MHRQLGGISSTRMHLDRHGSTPYSLGCGRMLFSSDDDDDDDENDNDDDADT